jgi:hypothetical protein
LFSITTIIGFNIYSFEVIAKVRNLPFDKLRVNGLRLKSLTFSVRGELVEPQKNTFAIGSFFIKIPVEYRPALLGG